MISKSADIMSVLLQNNGDKEVGKGIEFHELEFAEVRWCIYEVSLYDFLFLSMFAIFPNKN